MNMLLIQHDTQDASFSSERTPTPRKRYFLHHSDDDPTANIETASVDLFKNCCFLIVSGDARKLDLRARIRCSPSSL